RMHNKPLIHQEDFSAWAKQKLAGLENDSELNILDSERTDGLVEQEIDETHPAESPTNSYAQEQPTMSPHVESIPLEPEPETEVDDSDWVNYADYLAVSDSSYETPNTVATSTPTRLEHSTFKKAHKRTKHSASATAGLFVGVIALQVIGLPVPSAGLSPIGSMIAAVVTVIFGITAIVMKVQQK